MTRKGYSSEYQAKKMLQAGKDPESVQKVAIAQQGADFVVYSDTTPLIEKLVEVKECHGKKKYYAKREKDQIERTKKWCQNRQVRYEIWIHYPKERRWEVEKVV